MRVPVKFLVSFFLVALGAEHLRAQGSTVDRGRTYVQGPVVGSIRQMYEPVRDNIIASVDAMPVDHLNFRPTPEVRSFAEVLLHIGFAQFSICSSLRGISNPHPEPDKPQPAYAKEVVETYVREAFAFCDPAYAEAKDPALAETVSFFGAPQSRHFALTYNIVHANEHYGNLVTYMRLKGVVPPSTAPNPPR